MKTQPMKTQADKMGTATKAKSDTKMPMTGKTETHSMNTPAEHNVAKAPVKETMPKG